MKVTKEDINTLALHISRFDTQEMRDDYKSGSFKRSERTKDLDKRYRWDLFYCARQNFRHKPLCLPNFESAVKEYNSDHLDTALKKLVKPL